MHYSRLAESVNPYNPLFQTTMQGLVQSFQATGYSSEEAQGLALARMSQWITSQATFLSTQDGFAFLGAMALCGIAFALWQREIR